MILALSQHNFQRGTPQGLYNQRIPHCLYAFAHSTGRKAGEPV